MTTLRTYAENSFTLFTPQVTVFRGFDLPPRIGIDVSSAVSELAVCVGGSAISFDASSSVLVSRFGECVDSSNTFTDPGVNVGAVARKEKPGVGDCASAVVQGSAIALTQVAVLA